MAITTVEPRRMSLEASEIRSTAEADFSDVPRFAVLHAYWERVRDGRDMPNRADIDPMALKQLLGWLFIAEHRSAQDDFYYRLIGSNLTLLHGKEFTRKTVAEVFDPVSPEISRSIVAGYKKVIRENVSLRVTGRFVWANKDWMRFDSLHLPLRGGEGQGDMVLGILDFGDIVAG